MRKTRSETLADLSQRLAEEELQTMLAKNDDYTAKSEDPFANFRVSEVVGVPAELSILVRLMDKIQRIKSFVVNGSLSVKSETVYDAISDGRNYLLLLRGLIEEKQAESEL